MSKRLRGQAGTKVNVKVHRPYVTDSILNFEITRRQIEVDPLPYYGMLRDGIGYVGLTTFNANSADALKDAIIDMRSKGDLKATVTYSSRDELGSLADSLRTVMNTLSAYVNDISGKLGMIEGGNLNTEMEMEYAGDFAPIRASGNQIIDSLNNTLGQINQSAEQVASGSEQVSSGAQALSQGATEQASSVEELAATINELSGQVTNTASNARDVNNLIDSTRDAIDGCNQQMGDMMHAMEKINTSSSEIGKIIKTIEDIAFQTNILALNAAVEADRKSVV